MPTIRQVYQDALSPNYGVEEMAIRLLLVRVNGFSSMTELFTHMDDQMKGVNDFQRLFARVLSGEPVQYVLLETTFFGFKLFVDPRVLIPRPETEELVEKVINEEKQYQSQPIVIADIGTGSGCIALALEKSFPKATIFAIDSSDQALEVAEINKTNHSSSIRILKGDLLSPLLRDRIQLDLLISNPPYIERKGEVEKNVLDFEPHSALFAPNGIDCYVSMIHVAPFVMKEGGRIYFEINHDQQESLEKVLKDYLPNCQYRFIKDMQKRTRYLFIIYRKGNERND